jgi:pantetheine-phosphate adenylyltransferase
MRIVYPGTFDPITNGHVDLISRASRQFSEVIVAIGENSSKTPRFSVQEREELIKEVCAGLPNVTVSSFAGLLVDHCKVLGVTCILRGLRALTDFEFEMAIAQANAKIRPGLETFFLPTAPEISYISSTVVKEIAKHGGDTTPFVPPAVARELAKKRVEVRVKTP